MLFDKAVRKSLRSRWWRFVMAVVAVLFGLFVLAYCHMQHLSRFGTLRSAVGANGKSVVVTIASQKALQSITDRKGKEDSVLIE